MATDLSAVRERVELVIKYTNDGSADMAKILREDVPQMIAEIDVLRRSLREADARNEQRIREQAEEYAITHRTADIEALTQDRDLVRQALTKQVDEAVRLAEKHRIERDEAYQVIAQVAIPAQEMVQLAAPARIMAIVEAHNRKVADGG